MDEFANILLATMGWSNSHLHAFDVGSKRYGMNYDDYPRRRNRRKGGHSPSGSRGRAPLHVSIRLW